MSKASPRRIAVHLADAAKSYEHTLYALDDGMWTIYEISKRAIAKAPSENEAIRLIRALEARDAAVTSEVEYG